MKKEFIIEGEIRPIKLIEKIEGLIVEIRSKTNSNFVNLEAIKGCLFGYHHIPKKEIKPFEENIGILQRWIVLLEEILGIIKENSKIINFLNNEFFRPEIEDEYLKSEKGMKK